MRRLGRAQQSYRQAAIAGQSKIHSEHVADHRRIFATEGGAIGKQWDRYSNEPIYRKMKLARTGDYHLLRWPGGPDQIYQSLVSRGADHVFTWQVQNKTSVARAGVFPKSFGLPDVGWKFGTSNDVAQKHTEEAGGGIGPFKEPFPPRQMVGISDQARRVIVRTFQKWISDALRN